MEHYRCGGRRTPDGTAATPYAFWPGRRCVLCLRHGLLSRTAGSIDVIGAVVAVVGTGHVGRHVARAPDRRLPVAEGILVGVMELDIGQLVVLARAGDRAEVLLISPAGPAAGAGEVLDVFHAELAGIAAVEVAIAHLGHQDG